MIFCEMCIREVLKIIKLLITHENEMKMKIVHANMLSTVKLVQS